MQVDSKTPETELEDKREDESKNRRCLMCGGTFPSKWAGERICRKCKSSSAWRMG